MKIPISFLVFCSVICTQHLFAQSSLEDPEKGKFKKSHVFLGTGLNLGIGSRSLNLGLNPEIGYSLTNWLDAGIALNLNYFSQNATEYNPYRYRNLNLGTGPFLRVWPVSFLHFQIQPEFNHISSHQKNMQTNQAETFRYNANSLLVGIGYGTRILKRNYSYVTLMIDVTQDKHSPYRDQFNDPLPVFRAGFGMNLKSKH